MSLLPTSVDYSSKDFDSLRERLISLVRGVFPEWTDFDVASFGNILLELFAFVGDMLLFYQDNQARESRLVTATQRKNVIALARMLGYSLQGAQAATVPVQLTLDAPPPARVEIPAGTLVRTQQVTDPVVFQLLSAAVIAAGANPPTVTVDAEHSRSHTQLVDAQGQSNFDVYLDAVPYLDGSVSISTSQGAFSEVDNFLDSGPTDRHFVVMVDQNDRALVRFGNGVNGLQPTGTVSIFYKTGGGIGGRVDAGQVRVIEGSFVADNGAPVRVSVTNPSRSVGAVDRQSIESAQQQAPLSLRATQRSVAREDFEIHATELPSVARALMLTSNELIGIAENSGRLFIVPEGGGEATPSLKSQVLRQVTVVYPCTLTFTVGIESAIYRTVDIVARVYLRQGTSRATARANISQALADYFQITNDDGTPNTNVDFGFNMKDADGEPASEIAWSDLFNVVRDAGGIRKIGSASGDFLVGGQVTDLQLLNYEFPVLGTLTLIDGDTGTVF